MNLILKMEKSGGAVTIICEDKKHFNRLLHRYRTRGYKQIPYVEEVVLESLPF
jgi:hypothetical protein